MKKLINTPETVVSQMLRGVVTAHPSLSLDAKYKVVSRKTPDKRKVILISGGGSGHEPAHAGFVGPGMLDAAVCGDVFASPSQIQVYSALRGTAGEKGTLLIIKNYSGDMMNFKNAAHMAWEDGIEVDYVKVDDDIAVQDSLYTVGRRGVAGTVFVHKIAGAASARGMSLAEVKQAAEKAASNVKTIGLALTSCTVPAKGSPTFELGELECEYGVGIHGEPGIAREPLKTAKEYVKRMVSELCRELEVCEGARTAVLVNGFGATPLMELYLVFGEVARELAARGITIARSLVGNYMTSIDMSGASISILKLDDDLESLLNAPCDTPALKINGTPEPCDYTADEDSSRRAAEPVNYGVTTPVEYSKIGQTLTLENMIYIIDVMSESAIRNEAAFCELDSHAGDGDFGMSLAKGFKRLKEEWRELIQNPDISGFLNACALVIMEHCGGASGPIWGSGFRAAGKATEGLAALTVSGFSQLLNAACDGIRALEERSFGRRSNIGDKVLIDALLPACESWRESAERGLDFIESFKRGAESAVKGALSTKDIPARMGRAGTVGNRSLGHPDAGAEGLSVIFTDIANSLSV